MRISETFAAGVPKTYAVIGNFFRLQGASSNVAGSVDVRFWRDGRLLSVDMLGSDPGDWVRALPDGFNQVEITSTQAQTVAFQIMRGDVGSDRITGNVNVVNVAGGTIATIDGESTRSAAAVCFMGYGTQGAVAAQYNTVQLWNPAASGKTAFVEQISMQANTVSVMRLARLNAALTTLAQNPGNKLLGAAASVMEIRTQSPGSPLGVTFGIFYIEVALKTMFYRFTKPVAIPPGQGMLIAANTTDRVIEVNYEYFETTP